MTGKSSIRWKQRFENYEKAYKSLIESQKALEDEPENRFIQDSVIQRYAYTIKLAWKTIKDYLEEGFIGVTSPKKVIRKAFQEGIIQNANGWMRTLDDRNKTTHIYEKTVADEIVTAITKEHIPLFYSLYHHMKLKQDG